MNLGRNLFYRVCGDKSVASLLPGLELSPVLVPFCSNTKWGQIKEHIEQYPLIIVVERKRYDIKINYFNSIMSVVVCECSGCNLWYFEQLYHKYVTFCRFCVCGLYRLSEF